MVSRAIRGHAGLFGSMAALTMLAATADAQTSAAPPETQEVQQLANRWTEAYNRRNAAALGALYVEDARLYLHGSPTVSGRRNIQTYWADDMKEKNPITVLTVTHAVNGIDMKLVHGNYQVIKPRHWCAGGTGPLRAHLDADCQRRMATRPRPLEPTLRPVARLANARADR